MCRASFPYTAGVFPFKREGEDPTRMFAGEGGPERTNKRFHYVSQGLPAARLSTAFDSVTLYGEDPDYRPDIYGKIGNSGVSICCLDDAKKLYSGFDLCDPKTSVSMTINGPAATIAAFFMNAAIDQQCEKYIREHGMEMAVEAKLKEKYEDRGLERPRYRGRPAGGQRRTGAPAARYYRRGSTGAGGVPKDQSLRPFGRARHRTGRYPERRPGAEHLHFQYRIQPAGDGRRAGVFHQTRSEIFTRCPFPATTSPKRAPTRSLNWLSPWPTASPSWNTTLSRGMKVDDFAPNLSFFFSNGVDPEYAVIGRVARRIWAKAMRFKYGANQRSQMLKYHIQTSGRSLHAQEIAFNDIRTTCRPCTPFTTTAIRCIPTPTTRPSPHLPKNRCAAPWPSS
jgi:methylmalonyl-CoA mutase